MRNSSSNKQGNWNALCHGITAKRVLPTENQEDYDALRESYFNRFRPADAVEARCVQTMVDSVWRQERIIRNETQCLIMAHDRQLTDPETLKIPDLTPDKVQAVAFDYVANLGNTMSLFMRYEATYRRSYDRAHARLKELQANRPSPEPGPAPAPAPVDIEPEPKPAPAGPAWQLELQKLQNENSTVSSNSRVRCWAPAHAPTAHGSSTC